MNELALETRISNSRTIKSDVYIIAIEVKLGNISCVTLVGFLTVYLNLQNYSYGEFHFDVLLYKYIS